MKEATYSNNLYLVITNAGYWGQGETLNEALKNAEVYSEHQFVAFIWDSRVIEELYVNEFGGMCYRWKSEIFDNKPLYEHLQEYPPYKKFRGIAKKARKKDTYNLVISPDDETGVI